MTSYFVQKNGIGPVEGPFTWRQVIETVRELEPGNKLEISAEVTYPEDR